MVGKQKILPQSSRSRFYLLHIKWFRKIKTYVILPLIQASGLKKKKEALHHTFFFKNKEHRH